jgi:hypothetical protein
VERGSGKNATIMNIGFLITALKGDHYGICNEIEISKGKWEIVESWSEAKQQIKRQWQSRRL